MLIEFLPQIPTLDLGLSLLPDAHKLKSSNLPGESSFIKTVSDVKRRKRYDMRWETRSRPETLYYALLQHVSIEYLHLSLQPNNNGPQK